MHAMAVAAASTAITLLPFACLHAVGLTVPCPFSRPRILPLAAVKEAVDSMRDLHALRLHFTLDR